MAVTVGNIQFGPPRSFTLKSADDASPVEIGATVEGVTIFYSKESIEVTCPEKLSTILVFQDMERAEMRVRFKEHSMRNMLIAAGVDPSDTYGLHTVSGSPDIEYAVVGGRSGLAEEFSGVITRRNRASSTANDVITFWRGVVAKPGFEIKYAKEITEHDVVMLLLPKTSTLVIDSISFDDALFYVARSKAS